MTETEYTETVRAFTRFLGGQGDAVLGELRAEMESASAAREYERASVFRDRIRAVIGEPYRTTGSFDEYQHLGLAVLFDEDELHDEYANFFH